MKKSKIKWWAYLFPIAFISLSALIVFEGATPGNESSVQSKWFASVFDRGQENASIIAPTSLSMDEEAYTLYLEDELELRPVFTPADASDKRVAYNVLSSEGVALINGNKIKGVKEGEAKVEAVSQADPNLKCEFSVKVVEQRIKTLELSIPSSSLIKGMTSEIKVSSNKKETGLDEVEFTSSNPEVAYVSTLGFVHSLAIGETTLSCFSKQDPSICSSVNLKVIEGDFVPATSLSCPSEASFYVGEKKPIEPVFNPGCSDKALYASSLPKGLSFEGDTFSSETEGEYLVTLSSVNNPSLTSTITVKALEVKPASISVSFSSIQYGKTEKLDYSLVSEKADLPVTHPEVSFLSSDPSVASVDENGYLIGYKKGSVDITVSWANDPSIKGKASIAITSMDGEIFDNINYIVRKAIGHFLSFCLTAVFGVLTCFFFLKKKAPFWAGISIGLVYGLLLAMLSELLQIFTADRGPSWNDVGIDFFGYATGFAFTFLVAFFIHRTIAKRRGACIDKGNPD